MGTRHHAPGERTGRPIVGHAQGDDEPKLYDPDGRAMDGLLYVTEVREPQGSVARAEIHGVRTPKLTSQRPLYLVSNALRP